MTKYPIYLDFNATTPVHPIVLEAMLPFFGPVFGNPSSAHPFGFRLRAAMNTARGQVAALIGAQEDEIVFTSCGSESNNLALKGLAFAAEGRRDHIVISAVEHPAVTNTARFLSHRGFSVTTVRVDGYGRVDPETVREAVTERTLVVSVLHGQNELEQFNRSRGSLLRHMIKEPFSTRTRLSRSGRSQWTWGSLA
jgi:cysteine desulfurase